jgi:hypothetical protein
LRDESSCIYDFDPAPSFPAFPVPVDEALR